MPSRYGKKSTTSKKGRRPRRYPKISFKDKVLHALQGRVEVKVAKLSETSVAITNLIQTPLQLMPNIKLGTSSHAQRIGSSIMLKKLTIKGFIQMPIDSETTAVGGEFLARLFVLRQRNMNSGAIINDPLLFDENNLMEYQQPYTGSPSSWLQHVNRDKFIARRDVKMHISVQSNYQGADTSTANPDSVKFFTITLTFGKGKHLHYATDLSNYSTDFPYFLTAALHTPLGLDSIGAASFNYNTEALYTDM